MMHHKVEIYDDREPVRRPSQDSALDPVSIPHLFPASESAVIAQPSRALPEAGTIDDDGLGMSLGLMAAGAFSGFAIGVLLSGFISIFVAIIGAAAAGISVGRLIWGSHSNSDSTKS